MGQAQAAGLAAEVGRVRQVVLAAGGPTLREARSPARAPDEVLVRTLWTGIDGTDEEVAQGRGEPPPGKDELVLGHEALGEVLEAPPGTLEAGARVVPLVREGCGRCAACQTYRAPDLCSSLDYRERGIKGLDGVMRDLWTATPSQLVEAPPHLGALAVLAEPLSVLVKALDHARLVQARLPWFQDGGGFRGQRALLAGTGSLGTLGGFLLVHHGLRVWALDRSADEAAAPTLLRELGVRHINAREQDVRAVAADVQGFDLVIEATGSSRVAFEALETLAPNGVMVALGVPSGEPELTLEAAEVVRRLVLGNQALVGSVNSGAGHVREALRLLSAFRARWPTQLDRVLSHVWDPEDCADAFRADGPEIVKKALRWA